MTMRIALLTHNWARNFGANLQCLATVRHLERLGHAVTVLNYRPPRLVEYYRRIVAPAQEQMHEDFCNTYLPQSPILPDERAVIAHCNDTRPDLVIVGSDAILCLRNEADTEDRRFPNPFWINWVKRLSRRTPASYLSASSMGTNFFSLAPDTRRGTREALRLAQIVSVRDRWTRYTIWAATGGRVFPRWCADPASILNDVVTIPPERKRASQEAGRPYLLFSPAPHQLSPAWVKQFVGMAHDRGLRVVGLPLAEGSPDVAVDEQIPLPLHPLEWYHWIQRSAGYVGIRFHPVVCAAINEVPFVSLDGYGRKLFGFRIGLDNKVYDFCMNLGLQRRSLVPEAVDGISPAFTFETLTAKLPPAHRARIEAMKASYRGTIDAILKRAEAGAI